MHGQPGRALELQRITYDELTAKQKEIYNFQKVAAILADFGFNCIKLDDDWQGAESLPYHKDGQQTLKVQLKDRLSIYRKYFGKEIYMCFPIWGSRHLVHHDHEFTETSDLVLGSKHGLTLPQTTDRFRQNLYCCSDGRHCVSIAQCLGREVRR